MATLEVRSLATLPGPDGSLVHDVSFALEEGQVTALLLADDTPASGLLRAICGLEAPAAGDVLLGGVSVLGLPPHRRGIGLVFEDPALFEDRDAWDNVGFGLRMGGWPKAGREARVAELLDLVDLADRGGARIEALDADERRRLALARALAPEPAALLLEEPLGGLDEAQRASMRARLVSLLDRMQVTTLVATRSLADAVALAEAVVVLGHGRVLQAGNLADVLAQPVTAQVARLAGYQVLADGPIEEGLVVERGAGGIALPPDADLAGGATVMAHPSTVLAVPAGSGLGCGVRGFVRRSRPEGPASVLEVDLGERMVEAKWEWDLLPPPLGTSVEIAVRPGTLRFFGTPRAVIEQSSHVEERPPFEAHEVRNGGSAAAASVASMASGAATVPAASVAVAEAPPRTRTARERVLEPLITKNGHGPGFVRPPLQEGAPVAPTPPGGGGSSGASLPRPGTSQSQPVARHLDMPSFD